MAWYNDWSDFKDAAHGVLGAPMRTGGQYENINQENFNLPGYEQRSGDLQNFANTRGGGEFREGQSQLSKILMDQAQGKSSLSAEQLRQQQGRLQSMQASMAAGARPSQQAMARRQAMQNAGMVGTQIAGQGAMAGIAERNAAAQSLGGVLQGARGQDINAYLGAQGLGLQNAGMQQGGMINYEGQRTQRYGAALGVPTKGEAISGVLMGGASALAGMPPGMGGGGGGALGTVGNPFYPGQQFDAVSDVRAKKNVRPIVSRSQEAPAGLPPDFTYEQLGKLSKPGRFDPVRQVYEGMAPVEGEALEGFLRTAAQPYEFQYKKGEGPSGSRVGPMAQNIERVAPEAVGSDRRGMKRVDYSKLMPATVAGLGHLQRKVDALTSVLSRQASPPARPPASVTSTPFRGIDSQLRATMPPEQLEAAGMTAQPPLLMGLRRAR